MSVASVSPGFRGSEHWKLDDGTSTSAERGRKFAESIATGSFKSEKAAKKKKEYRNFRKMFWEEPIYNASIINPNTIPYDQQFGEMEAHWSRAGKKFSDEPRIAKSNMYDSPGGPLKPEEFEHLFERPTSHFSHTRQKDPFRVARQYCKPVERVVHYKKLSRLEESTHLGPGAYRLPDPWLESAKPVCGVVRPSSFFMTTQPKGATPMDRGHTAEVSERGAVPTNSTAHPSPIRGLLQHPESHPYRAEPTSSIVPLPHGVRSTSVNDLYPSRGSTAFITAPSGFSPPRGLQGSPQVQQHYVQQQQQQRPLSESAAEPVNTEPNPTDGAGGDPMSVPRDASFNDSTRAQSPSSARPVPIPVTDSSTVVAATDDGSAAVATGTGHGTEDGDGDGEDLGVMHLDGPGGALGVEEEGMMRSSGNSRSGSPVGFGFEVRRAPSGSPLPLPLSIPTTKGTFSPPVSVGGSGSVHSSSCSATGSRPLTQNLQGVKSQRGSPVQRRKPTPDTPGFTFLRGPMATALTVVTGTTKADISYRRIQMPDGSATIMPVRPGDAELPPGAKVVASWATTATGPLGDSNETLPSDPRILRVNSHASVGCNFTNGKYDVLPSKSGGASGDEWDATTDGEWGDETKRYNSSPRRPIASPPLPTANGSAPRIEKLTPWKPPKFQSKSFRQREYEKRLMRKMTGGTSGSMDGASLSGGMMLLSMAHSHSGGARSGRSSSDQVPRSRGRTGRASTTSAVPGAPSSMMQQRPVEESGLADLTGRSAGIMEDQTGGEGWVGQVY